MTAFLPNSTGLLKPIEQHLEDPLVSEIIINKPQEIWVEKNNVMSQHIINDFSDNHLIRLFRLIANENNKVISNQHPILSGSLLTGERIQLCFPPTSYSPALAIRKASVKSLSLAEYQNAGFYQKTKNNSLQNVQKTHLNKLHKEKNWPQFIGLAIALKKNIVISGGTSSGKTTFLNACLKEIELKERLLILEDTREIRAPHPNQLALLSSKDQQGFSNVSMQALVQCSLRLRPDRILMGEIRGAEMMDFVSACSTGHEGSLTTIHANSPELAFSRMLQLYKMNNVPSMTDNDILKELKQVIDVIIQLEKSPQGRRLQGVYYKEAAQPI